MRVVVERIDAPLVAGAVVRRVADPVDRRIAHVDVGAREVDLEPQHVRAVRKLAGLHPPEEIEILGDAAASVDARPARLGQRAAKRAHLRRGRAVHVGEVVLDEPLGEIVELVVVVGRVIAMRAPVETEPAHRFGDRRLELDVFRRRVGVVEAEVAAAAVLRGQAEIQDDGLGVSVVQITVRLGRKARDHLAAVFARSVVLGDDGAQEIGRRRGRSRRPSAGAGTFGPVAGSALRPRLFAAVQHSSSFCS